MNPNPNIILKKKLTLDDTLQWHIKNTSDILSCILYY